MTRHALVIGGGIAGPAAAIALRKAGLTATVYEARPDGASNAGAALRLPRNGLDALRTIDVYQPIAEASVPLPRTDLGTGTGRHLGSVTLSDDSDVLKPRALARSTLSKVLCQEATRAGAMIETSKRLTHAEHTEGGVRATFDDGTTAEGDVLIGADGVRSTVRRIIDPSAPEPVYCGTHIVYGYTSPTTATPPSPEAFKIFWGKKATFGYTSATGDIYWYGSVAAPEPLSSDPLDMEQWRRRLLRLFRRDRTPATAIISTAKVIVATSTRELRNLPTWHNQAMTVIGDAAHAVVPATEQGAALAIEDAVVLAQCLRDTDDSGNALAAFERARRDRIDRAATSRRGRTGHRRGMPRWLEQRIRERKVTAALQAGAMSPPAWLHDFHIQWDQRML